MTISSLEALASAPDRLRDLLGRAPVAQREPTIGTDWTLRDVLLHVRASDTILTPRVFEILNRPGVALPAFDERVRGDWLVRGGFTVDRHLEAYAIARAELVGVLRSLSAEQWELAGRRETDGPMTIRQVVDRIAEHEAEHLAQAAALAGA